MYYDAFTQNIAKPRMIITDDLHKTIKPAKCYCVKAGGITHRKCPLFFSFNL